MTATLRRVGEWQREYPLAQALVVVAAFVWGASSIPGFTSKLSVYAMLVLASLLGVAAVGQTLTILVGGLDISIAPWIGAGATVTVELHRRGWSSVWIILVLVVCAVVVGGAAGLISFRFRVQSLIVTLATGAIVAGGVQVWGRGSAIGTPPAWLQRLTSPAGTTFGIHFPAAAVVWCALSLGVGFLLRRTVPGRWVYATGANPRAAALALVPTQWVWTAVFALSATFAALTGVLLAGFAGAGDQSVYDPYLWQSLSAVILGGTGFGGRGDYTRTVLGTMMLIVLTTVLIGKNYGYADQQILFGVLIFVVVALYSRTRRLRDRV
ncbi:MAG TPA: ABC transporter permease [Gaiellaceae bacterium]|nr:ABC transporter permease [Gaiellaceae bacterium]